MKSIVIHAPKDLRIEEQAEPVPGPGQLRIRVKAGGICGSDLHYYLHGGFGAVRLREPMVLGHEIAGLVDALGEGISGHALGQPVAVNPSLPCGACRHCLAGRPNHCLEMRFYGSAMRMPHVQGGFSDFLVCEAARAVPLPPGMSPELAAFAEPLAVCLHAARQAGPLLGARVLVTGAGPIGNLAIAVARHAGAREVVATDLHAA
ncbi:MAG: L-idonate 5-dehydrogenase, partial [Belnapia sp.]|nr:L-idonate 5-dehydrogenase [Belnapia sp.]